VTPFLSVSLCWSKCTQDMLSSPFSISCTDQTECHPHTNMAKAALNMLTRTSADDLAKKYRIFMNSVDTGWINDENPLEKASRIAKDNTFQTPIDEIDAAARILDPIFCGVNGDKDAEQMYGKFLKDYKESEW
jgi:NAD(P)-dependent dehydrogenase (short-subunit alcohol dehydrogenase family)